MNIPKDWREESKDTWILRRAGIVCLAKKYPSRRKDGGGVWRYGYMLNIASDLKDPTLARMAKHEYKNKEKAMKTCERTVKRLVRCITPEVREAWL